MFNPMTLEGRRILVTGASSGIGRACAVMAAQLGASVMLVGRRENSLNETLSLMGTAGEHRVLVGDVTLESDIDRLVGAVSEFGKLDGFVHSAGISLAAPMRMTEACDVRKLIETNYVSFVVLMKSLANRRNAVAGFSAVAISSVAAMAGWNGVTAYSGSKGALSATVRALAVELAPQKFRVNALCPSNIQTPMLDELLENLDKEQVLSALAQRQPLGIGRPEDVASAACFLLSDASRFITGVNLPVDGGYLAQ